MSQPPVQSSSQQRMNVAAQSLIALEVNMRFD